MPRAAGGPVEAVEDERQVGLVDPGAVVADGQLAAVHGDLDRAAGRAPLDGVVEQVATARSSAAGTPTTVDSSSSAADHDLRRAPLRALDRVVDEQVEPDVLGLGLLRSLARELDEVADERRHLLELLDDVAQQLLAPLGRRARRRARAPRCSCAGS